MASAAALEPDLGVHEAGARTLPAADVTVAIGLSQGYRQRLRVCLGTIPDSVPKIVSWYGPGEPDGLPPNGRLVRPRRHLDNYARGYVLNVAVRAVRTPYVLLADADLLFPRFFFQVLASAADRVMRFYVGRMTPEATGHVLGGRDSETLYADYQGQHGRVFRSIYGSHNPCLYPTKALHRLRGYDERFVGWGREDDDLSERTRRLGLRAVRVPILVACLDDRHVCDYPGYRRGCVSPANDRLLRDRRPVAANPQGWGDETEG